MRVTNQMNNFNSTRSLTSSYGNYSDLMYKSTSRQQITSMKDNPIAAITGLKAEAAYYRTEKYVANIKTGTSALDNTSKKMNAIKTLLDDAKKLVEAGANSATTNDGRQANASEIESIFKQIMMIANTKDGDRYIFGGTASGIPPFDSIGKYVIYKGDNNKIAIPTGDKLTTDINATGTDAFGNMTTTIPSRDLNAGVNLGSDTSTELSALNGGNGIPKGKITIYFSSYPEGLDVDLSSCETLEDVKDVIEKATLDASRELDPARHSWLDGSNLDWRDMNDRYVKVTVNPDGNGISLQEMDLGEPLPPPTSKEMRKGLTYSGTVYTDPVTGQTVDYNQGQTGVGAGALYDKNDVLYGDGTTYYNALRVDNHAGNQVASSLGIKGTANKFDPNAEDPRLDGFIHGSDLKPRISNSTLLADLEGWNDALWTLINGSKPGDIIIREQSQDENNYFNDWSLSNVSINNNTGPNGELYTRVTRRGPPDNDLYVEVFAKPIESAKASDLVATGSYSGPGTGGTVVLNEANNSGLSGTVGIHLPGAVDNATMNLKVEVPESRQAVINVPAFREQNDPYGTPRDYLNMLSGWHITGLDKPPASGFDINHPASTDPDGNISVNIRTRQNNDGPPATTSVVVELVRPAYGDQPAALVATGELNIGVPPLDVPASGRISFEGMPGFEGVGGSVYVELPANTTFQNNDIGKSAAAPTDIAYALTGPLAANNEIVLGGAMKLVQDQTLAGNMTIHQDTVFLKGQVFNGPVPLPGGGTWPTGVPLDRDVKFTKGTVIPAGTTILAGTVLQGKQDVTFSDPLAAGTVIPAGSYTTSGSGFPAHGMLSPDMPDQVMGFNLEATFATVEDLMRAVEEADIYAAAQINADGTGIEFMSRLAGAYLTVIEDTDCYEQMNDKYQQLSALDMNGTIKGVNTDPNGDMHTEIIYYPPDPQRTDGKVMLIREENGEQILIDAGYYVRVYKDKDALNQPYEDRDNSLMVAEGFIPAGDWDDPTSGTYDPTNPFVPNANSGAQLGFRQPLILQERNDSGLSGTVNFDYYGGRDQADPTLPADEQYRPYNNADLTITPGGLRTTSSVHTTLQEIDVSGFTPGIHADYSGNSHATIEYEEGPPEKTTVYMYRDSSRTHMVAKGEINADTGEITLFETDRSGAYTLDLNGDPIRIGSIVVADNQLLDGQSDNFTITMGGVNNGGQKKEENLFSTINDALDALYANDMDALHDLLDVIQKDINRLVAAGGDVDARSKRITLLSDRYSSDLIAFDEIYQSTVGMDENAFIKYTQEVLMAEQQFSAAMMISTRYMQLSILDYI